MEKQIIVSILQAKDACAKAEEALRSMEQRRGK
jgi:hypothetical protein